MLAGFVLTLLQDRGDVDSNDDGKKVAPLSHVRREVRIDVQFNIFPPDREILQKIDLRMSNFVLYYAVLISHAHIRIKNASVI